MKKRKENRNYIFTTLAFLMILIFSINAVTKLLSKKDSIAKYGDMMKTQNFDVLFMGTSHVLNGIFPMELWNDYGIVSYNCGGNANQLPTTYHVMNNVLKYYHPKLVVLDVYCIESNDKIIQGRSGVDCQHISFDWLPLTKEKIEAVNFLFDDIETKLEFIFPISIYHERWMGLKESDFKINYNLQKGADCGWHYSRTRDFELIDKTDMIQEDSLGKQYLAKMIELCQEKGIEILLINIPYPATKEQQQWANSVQVIADEYKVEYLNLMYEETGVNLNTDCQDIDSHLNSSGGRKVTDFLGKHLQKHYNMPDRRMDENYSDWYEDYKAYSAYKWQNLIDTKNDINAYLSILQDNNLNICLYFNGDSEIMKDDVTTDMVLNIANLQQLKDACAHRKDYFAIIDNNEQQICEYTGDEAIDSISTSFAKFSLSEKKDGTRCLYLNDVELNLLLNGNGTTAELVIVSFDKNSGEMVDWVKFDTQKSVSGS